MDMDVAGIGETWNMIGGNEKAPGRNAVPSLSCDT